jgi:hypothetical protein
MKTVTASALAMITGWGVALGALAGWELFTRAYVEDLKFMAWWTALFSFLAWCLIVLPILALCPHARLLHAPRWSWAGWMLLAIGSYSLLVASWLGREAFEILWYPAAMGIVAGICFGLFRSTFAATSPRATTPTPSSSGPRA